MARKKEQVVDVQDELVPQDAPTETATEEVVEVVEEVVAEEAKEELPQVVTLVQKNKCRQ